MTQRPLAAALITASIGAVVLIAACAGSWEAGREPRPLSEWAHTPGADRPATPLAPLSPARPVAAESPAAAQTPLAPQPGFVPDLRLAVLREGRAYDGAPPVIAHPPSFGDECTECHLDGSDGFDDPGVPPPTPHPELQSCRMCHVYKTTGETFGANTYQPAAYVLGRRATPTSPPLIPHPLTMRERCVVCHNGSTLRADLAPTHSEAWNCRMCHVPADGSAPGPRRGISPVPQGGSDE